MGGGATKGRGGHPRLGISMIVRDEAECLGRCLESVADLADELVIVDTGSTDATREIAGEFGAKVFEVAWEEDFSAARNAALAQMTSDWVLSLDADETIAPRDHGVLRALLEQPGLDAYRVVTRNYCVETRAAEVAEWQDCVGEYPQHEQGYRGWFPSVKVRLFRNDRRVRFAGQVHETVEASLAALGARLAEAPVPVHHGGALDPRRRRAKAARYLAASQEKIRNAPRDPHAFLEAGLHHYELQEFAAAAAACERAIALQDEDLAAGRRAPSAAFTDAHTLLAALRMGAGEFEAAATLLRRAIALRSDESDTFLNLGVALERLGKVAEAKEMTCRALQLDAANAQARRNLRRMEERRARLSLCMIVRDEAQHIVPCLRSFAALADEIIVVDTGSRDATAELAAQEGARVEHFAWCNDFAAARNASLRYAAGDFIIWVDADDRISPVDAARLRRELVPGERVAYFVKLRNRQADDRSTVSYQLRIVPNVPGVAFSGIIHEQLLPSLQRLGIPTASIEATIEHLGYVDEGEGERKLARNEALLTARLEAAPDDHYTRYMLGMNELKRGRSEACMRLFEDLLAALPEAQEEMAWALHARVWLGAAYGQAGRMEEARREFDRVRRIDPAFWLVEYQAGLLAFRRGELATARQCLERLAQVDFSVSLIPVDVAEVSFRYHAAYGRCLQRAQDYATAISHYAAAAAFNPCDAELHLWYVECLLQAGEEAAVEELVERLARDPRAPGLAAFIRGTLAMRANDLDAASTFLRAAQAAGYESAPLSFNLGLAAVRRGEVAEAERYYRAALALDPTFMEAHLNLAYLHLVQEQPEAARQAFERLVTLFPECSEARLRLSGLYLQGGEVDACLTQLEQLCARLQVGTRAHLTTLEEIADLYLMLARRLGARHDLAAAKAAAETALLVAPAHAGAHRELGRLCFLRREHHAARQHLEAALRQGSGGDIGSFELLGKTYAALGVPDAAALCYEMEEAGNRRASRP